MKKIIVFANVGCLAFILAFLSGCGSSSYDRSHNTYYEDTWDYDRYYRAGINRHYNHPRARGPGPRPRHR